jgi:hypothetical protein
MPDLQWNKFLSSAYASDPLISMSLLPKIPRLDPQFESKFDNTGIDNLKPDSESFDSDAQASSLQVDAEAELDLPSSVYEEIEVCSLNFSKFTTVMVTLS